VRLLYVRTLATSQRLPEAAAEITVLTQSDPNLAPPWLTLGALELEMKRRAKRPARPAQLRSPGRRRRGRELRRRRERPARRGRRRRRTTRRPT
jgi:hypothetical protein